MIGGQSFTFDPPSIELVPEGLVLGIAWTTRRELCTSPDNDLSSASSQENALRLGSEYTFLLAVDTSLPRRGMLHTRLRASQLKPS
jgi:hypothetical protein